ncbi:hypothetical protein HanIR_Chr01g0017161 [Helianthus annuus]|nr:hypothetical protein HanIR_Chr01g0017161 [Helianthus annuus]
MLLLNCDPKVGELYEVFTEKHAIQFRVNLFICLFNFTYFHVFDFTYFHV